MNNEPEQEALFEIEGPDEDGCVWISSTGENGWCHNLGPREKVAEVLSHWLRSINFDERLDRRDSGRTWSKTELRALKHLLEHGRSIPEMSAQLGRSQEAVRRRAAMEGWPVDPAAGNTPGAKPE